MKKYEVRANSRNTPHYYERMLVGALLFVFTGLNWILPFVIFGTIDPKSAIYMIVFGVGNLDMASIIFIDNRSAMVKWIVIICYGVIYLAVSIGIAVMRLLQYSLWYLDLECCKKTNECSDFATKGYTSRLVV